MSKSTGNFKTLKEAIKEFSADATRFSLADAGDGVDDANFVFETANAAILRLTKEISCMEEVQKSKSSLRTDPPSTYADRVFANEINIAVKAIEQNYRDYMFREALKSGFYDLQAARDEYRFSCGTGGHEPFVGRAFYGFVIKAGWPAADSPDLTLKAANKYLQDPIVLMRKLLQKQMPGSKKGIKKGATAAPITEDKISGLIYVNEQFDGWKAECLKILQSKFNRDIHSFASDGEIMEALKNSSLGQTTNFKQTQNLCMPFLSDPNAVAKAGSLGSLLNQNPPSPGNPTAIFLTRQ